MLTRKDFPDSPLFRAWDDAPVADRTKLLEFIFGALPITDPAFEPMWAPTGCVVTADVSDLTVGTIDTTPFPMPDVR